MWKMTQIASFGVYGKTEIEDVLMAFQLQNTFQNLNAFCIFLAGTLSTR